MAFPASECREAARSTCPDRASTHSVQHPSRQKQQDVKPFLDGRSAGASWRYRGTITREQWLLRESQTIARMRMDGISDDDILAESVSHNPFQYPTEREIKSITRACLLRVNNLSDDPELRDKLVHALAYGTSTQAIQVNLYAIMRTYRLVWEFMIGVVGHKFMTFDTRLARYEITEYLEGLRHQSDVVAGWSDTTLNKIRQVLSRYLVEAGYLTSTRSDELRPVLLDLELEQAMRANGDTAALPAFNCLD